MAVVNSFEMACHWSPQTAYSTPITAAFCGTLEISLAIAELLNQNTLTQLSHLSFAAPRKKVSHGYARFVRPSGSPHLQ